jgi:DNA mismatch repair protein MutL
MCAAPAFPASAAPVAHSGPLLAAPRARPAIRRLPEALVNQIAAGEVVERPASALKELVENALDAGATRIAIALAGGGLDGVEVADDGCGMAPAELRLAVERHATSKLPEGRLDAIATLGFRGEALPSIGSVARLAITSRPPGADEAWRLVVDHGAIVADEPAARPPGTTVAVRELFARVPARRKFLRSPRAELAACLDVARALAMAAPGVAFRLEHDSRRLLDLPAPPAGAGPEEARRLRLVALMGERLLADAVPVAHERSGLAIAGVAGLPTASLSAAAHQYFVIAGRPVRDRLLAGALRGAYAGLLERARHPVAALFLDAPPGAVDVNVHPAKAEVRFADPEAARALVVGGIRRALDAAGLRPAVSVGAAALGALRAGRPGDPPAEVARARAIVAEAQAVFAGPAAAAELPLPGAARPAAPVPGAALAEAPAPPPATGPLGRPLAQLHGLYILAETADGLVLVDAHAAHERVTLERLKSARAGAVPATQALLLPEVVDLTEADALRLEAAAQDLAAQGLAMERFGPRAVVVRAIPAALAGADIAALVRDLAAELAQGAAESLADRLDARLATAACRASVMAGRRLSLAEMDALLRAMEATPDAGQCNHGRPTFVSLRLTDIERLFGRR